MKKGISLIVLVITIIVIIILAGAVILSISQNNPIAQANQATKASDKVSIQSAVTMYLSKIMSVYKDEIRVTPGELAAGAAVTTATDLPLYIKDGKYTTDSTGGATAVIVNADSIGIKTLPNGTWKIDAYGNISE